MCVVEGFTLVLSHRAIKSDGFHLHLIFSFSNREVF